MLPRTMRQGQRRSWDAVGEDVVDNPARTRTARWLERYTGTIRSTTSRYLRRCAAGTPAAGASEVPRDRARTAALINRRLDSWPTSRDYSARGHAGSPRSPPATWASPLAWSASRKTAQDQKSTRSCGNGLLYVAMPEADVGVDAPRAGKIGGTLSVGTRGPKSVSGVAVHGGRCFSRH